MSTSSITSAPTSTEPTTSTSTESSTTSSRRGFQNGYGGGSGMENPNAPQYHPARPTAGNSDGKSHPMPPGFAIAAIVVLSLIALAVLGWCWRSHRRAKRLIVPDTGGPGARSQPENIAMSVTNRQEMEQKAEEDQRVEDVAAIAGRTRPQASESLVRGMLDQQGYGFVQ